MPRMIIVRGLPGSGKSTFAKSLGIFHVEQDMHCMKDGEYCWSKENIDASVRFCKNAVMLAVNARIDVVISNTFTRLWEMQSYIDFAHENGYEIFVYKAIGNYGSIHNVPESALSAMKERWEDYENETIFPRRIS